MPSARTDFYALDPEIVILHWDGKQEKFNPGTVQEHFCIVAQVPAESKSQFLGALRIAQGTGVAQADALMRISDTWGD